MTRKTLGKFFFFPAPYELAYRLEATSGVLAATQILIDVALDFSA